MAALVYLDTHVVVWLYTEGSKPIPSASIKEIEGCTSLLISPMARLELQYLYEIGRVSLPPHPVIDELTANLGLEVCNIPFPAVVREAENMHWTRDPFDRLIVAQASLSNALLITRDSTIQSNYTHAMWD